MQHRAFTFEYHGIANTIKTPVGVCLPFLGGVRPSRPEVKEYRAIWDTGATMSAVTKRLAQEMGLKPIGAIEMRHAGGTSFVNTYLVNIVLPDKVMIEDVRVSEIEKLTDENIPENQRAEMLIGMDIIATGDFAITNTNGRTCLSFRVPSVQRVDFVPDAKNHNATDGTGMNRAQRRALKFGTK